MVEAVDSGRAGGPNEMTLNQAVDLVARKALHDGEPEWESYPDIGENDWERVMARVEALKAETPWEQFSAAYDFLTARAEGVTS